MMGDLMEHRHMADMTGGCPPSTTDMTAAETRALLAAHIDIPADLDNEFEMQRWRQSNDNSTHDALMISTFIDYVRNRGALNLDDGRLTEDVFSRPHIAPFIGHIPHSRLGLTAVNSVDNSIILLQPMRHLHVNQLVHVMMASDWTMLYMTFIEYYHALVLRHEKESGKMSSCQIVFDFSGFHVGHYVGAQGQNYIRLAGMMVHIWQTYYSELVSTVYIVHPPALLSILWHAIKHFLRPSNQHRIVVADIPTLHKHISLDCLPSIYGGTMKNSGGWGDEETCVNRPPSITGADYKVRDGVWKENGRELPAKMDKKSLAYNSVFHVDVRVEGPKGGRILWHFETNFDCLFGVDRIDGDSSTRVFPSFTIRSLFLPEQRCLAVDLPGCYRLHFTNKSNSYFSGRLTYAVTSVP